MKASTIILVCLVLAGCEQTVQNPDWPEYKERIVCSANVSISPESASADCDLGKTVPLNQKADYIATRVNDAQVTVSRSTDTAALLLVGGGRYHGALPTNSEKTFSLQCRWGSLALHGQVTISTDLRLQLDTVIIVPDPWSSDGISGRFFLHVMPEFDYEVTLFSPTIFDRATFSFYAESVPPEGKLMMTSYPLKKGEWTYTITARNRNYRDHYANGGGGALDPSGRNPRHNMTGDGFGFLTYDVVGAEIPFTVK